MLFVLNAVFGAAAIIVVGIPVLLLTIPATRWLANRHRLMAGRVLGTPMPPQYRPTQPGDPVSRLVGWASDPMTWRDQAWLLAACTVGFALSLLSVLLLVLIVTGALWWFGIEPIMRARSAIDRWLLSYGHTETLEQRVQVLTETRADTLDHSAAELRRIERDLHDGAQARLVALVDEPRHGRVPVRVRPGDGRSSWCNEARAATSAALGDLRSVVRGIHPPVLADRGLGGAVSALALDMAIPVDGRPVELRRAPTGAGRVGRLLRGRRVPGQRRQALGARSTPGSRSRTRTASCSVGGR